MYHEAIKNLDALFKKNEYTVQEERFVKATALSIMAQIHVYKETSSEYLDHLLGHTFGAMLKLLSSELDQESHNRIAAATAYFLEQLNGEVNEHRKGH